MDRQMRDMRHDYVALVKTVLEYGDHVRVRGEATAELFDVGLRFRDPSGVMLPVAVGRGVNERLAAVEALSLVAGTAERDLTMAAAPGYARVLVSRDPADFQYAAYGPRLVPSVDTVVELLVADPTTRQAVLAIWREDDLYHEGDRPCTLTLQFLVRRDRLHLVVSMRSNDVWLGLAYDAFVFNQLHWTVLRRLNRRGLRVDLGEYRHHAASLHLYEHDANAARTLAVKAVDNVDDVPFPRGVDAPPGMFPDQAAKVLLHPPADVPVTVAEVEALNPWYAARMADVRARAEARA